MVFLDIIILIVFTEALTELTVKSELFKPIREFFFNRRHNRISKFFYNILDCPYCFSVWAALLALSLVIVGGTYIKFFIFVIVIHRFSNCFHFLIDKLRGSVFMDKD